ncbi:MAG: hypothetical protein N5P05_001337 [Chroococcopsis gigantea SAG 12.99]|jgi:uncharacterized protein YyaL (SSP411 family)|nr:thioredoxin domain-containing protein [Chlorogloea purpurea SAG 13.99]MDV2999731.1 hypothetical protein [Chroococcopsis gigantea SAG 12.99]
MPNRLANSQSLYLRKHAQNPIDWWSWSDAALLEAKNSDKPIFLSIGYSSCHWCTVMEGEAFSDTDIAAYMNENFLPIKVDREERPDIDSIYMQALQMMIGQGGWPLNIFLTPDDLIPFYGGTYFPVEARYDRPGFLQILQSVRRFYDLEKEKLNNLKTEMLNGLRNGAVIPHQETPLDTKELLVTGVESNTRVIAPNPDSFGRPSFPMIPYANLSLQGSRLLQDSSIPATHQRGLDLALGGIFDHVGGGFHRYTVDSTWTVPHFEKMLYDNGQILEYLANLWSSGYQEPAFQRAISKTVQWLKREMTSPAGYFYAAQDADNFVHPNDLEPEEGDFYVWSREELQSFLSPRELSAIEEVFTITSKGNFEGKNVFQRRQQGPLSQEIESILDKLFVHRYGVSAQNLDIFPAAFTNEEAKRGDWPCRIPPVTDPKMIVAWNSLVISGLARAYAVFAQSSYWDMAIDATNFILDRQWIEGRLYRLNYDGKASILAQSEDYAYFIKALLDLHQANPLENRWLETAIKIQGQMDELFWDEETGGYYNNAIDNSRDLIIRERSYIDNATPAVNGIALTNLIRLGLLTDNTHYRDQAETGLRSFASIMKSAPTACPGLFIALDWLQYGLCVHSTTDYLTDLIRHYFPATVYAIDGGLKEPMIGVICQGTSCREGAKSATQLREQIIALLQ